MAISTIASEKAMYKKMLVDWATSLALLFLLHYIIAFTFGCNEALIKAIATICENSNIDTLMEKLGDEALGIEIVSAVGAMILYGLMIYQTISFMLSYMKRMLTIGFLIMISPLITITYSIDKVGDGKAQALNTWLKEFVYNVLIQPFHCILFASFADVAFKVLGLGTSGWDSNLSSLILAVCCLQFIKTGEELVKKIFGFGQASSLATLAAGTMMTAAAISKGGQAGQAIGAGAAKTKNFLANHGDKISKATGALSKKANKAMRRFDNFKRDENGKIIRDKNGNAQLTERGQKALERKADRAAFMQVGNNGGNFNEIKSQLMKTKEASMRKNLDRKEAVLTAPANAKAKMNKLQENARKGIYNKKKERYESKHTGKTYEQHLEDKREKKNQREKEFQEITGYKGVGEFIQKNGKSALTGAVGAAGAIIGLGAGVGGSVAGGKLGAGIIQGYMANTQRTVNTDNAASAQAAANMNKDNPNFDMESKVYGVYATSQNGGYEKLEEKLDKILDKIQGLTSGQRESFKNDASRQLITNPTQFNEEFLQAELTKFGIKDEDGSALAGMKQYATLAADANLAKSITNSMNLGFKLEDIANGIVNNVSIEAPAGGAAPAQPVSGSGEGGDTEVVPDASEIARELKDAVQTSQDDTNVDEVQQQLRQTDASIRETDAKLSRTDAQIEELNKNTERAGSETQAPPTPPQIDMSKLQENMFDPDNMDG